MGLGIMFIMVLVIMDFWFLSMIGIIIMGFIGFFVCLIGIINMFILFILLFIYGNLMVFVVIIEISLLILKVG